MVNGGRVTSEVKSLGNHRFLASFVPHTATLHVVEMKFNDELVPGSPWKCNISSTETESRKPLLNSAAPDSYQVDSSRGAFEMSGFTKKGLIRIQAIENFPVGQTHSFDIIAPGYKKDEFDVQITGNCN